MGFTKNTCEEFVDVLASKAPVPGGGGASAIGGAIGNGLGQMVANLTIGKKKYAEYEKTEPSGRKISETVPFGVLILGFRPWTSTVKRLPKNRLKKPANPHEIGKKRVDIYFVNPSWCEGGDLNPHERNVH